MKFKNVAVQVIAVTVLLAADGRAFSQDEAAAPEQASLPEQQKLALECRDTIRFLQRYIENSKLMGTVYAKDLQELCGLPFCERITEIPGCPACGMDYVYSSNRNPVAPVYRIACPCPEVHGIESIIGTPGVEAIELPAIEKEPEEPRRARAKAEAAASPVVEPNASQVEWWKPGQVSDMAEQPPVNEPPLPASVPRPPSR